MSFTKTVTTEIYTPAPFFLRRGVGEAVSLSIYLDCFLPSTVSDRDDDSEADRGEQPDTDPERPDRLEHSRLPERQEHRDEEQDVPGEINADPFHAHLLSANCC